MNIANLKKCCWALVVALIVTNVVWALFASWKDSGWRLKYNTDIHEASRLLVYYDSTFKDRRSWPQDTEHWPGVSFLHLVSTNLVGGKKMHRFASEFGGAYIEIREAVDGSPYLSLGSREELR